MEREGKRRRKGRGRKTEGGKSRIEEEWDRDKGEEGGSSHMLVPSPVWQRAAPLWKASH
jgi:hypothetical protein